MSKRMSSEDIQSSLEAIRVTLEKLDDRFTVALANKDCRLDRFDKALQDQNNRFQYLDDRLKLVERINKQSCNTSDHLKDATGSVRGVDNKDIIDPIDPPAVQNPTFEKDEDNVKSTTSDGKMIASIFGLPFPTGRVL